MKTTSNRYNEMQWSFISVFFTYNQSVQSLLLRRLQTPIAFHFSGQLIYRQLIIPERSIPTKPLHTLRTKSFGMTNFRIKIRPKHYSSESLASPKVFHAETFRNFDISYFPTKQIFQGRGKSTKAIRIICYHN